MSGLFKDDGADQQKKANKLTQQSMRQQARQSRKARRVAVRTAKQDRRKATRQNRQLIAAEKQNAAELAKVGQNRNLRTDFIEDEEAKRRKLLAMGGRSAYGFSRPSGTGLGGGSSQLG